MPIDPKIEQPTRQMLAHAIKHELDDLAALIHAVGDKTFLSAIDLCVFAAGYIAIDVCQRWPTEADLREIARVSAQSETHLDISEEEIYALLSRVALGSEKLDDIFTVEGVGPVPLYATANLLLTFFPKGEHWFEYLDQIWNAADTAERTSLKVLPALMLRARREAERAAS